MSEIHFVDTTLRDGQQSLWALGMRTGAMLPIAAQMDRVGFESMEFFVSIMIKKYVREHKENPWIWLREGTKHFSRTRLRNHGGMHGSGAFEKLPHSVMRLLIERVVSYGITLTRTSNCWNDFQELKEELHQLRQVGMETIVNLIYSVSPRHSDAYYAERARQAAAIRPYRICFKDVGGLLTPERTRTLDSGYSSKRGRCPCGVSRALQQRVGASMLSRSGEARDHNVAYRDSAPCQRLLATFYSQRGQKSPGFGLQSGDQ